MYPFLTDIISERRLLTLYEVKLQPVLVDPEWRVLVSVHDHDLDDRFCRLLQADQCSLRETVAIRKMPVGHWVDQIHFYVLRENAFYHFRITHQAASCDIYRKGVQPGPWQHADRVLRWLVYKSRWRRMSQLGSLLALLMPKNAARGILQFLVEESYSVKETGKRKRV